MFKFMKRLFKKKQPDQSKKRRKKLDDNTYDTSTNIDAKITSTGCVFDDVYSTDRDTHSDREY